MRIVLYARVSTRDRDQDPETQLHRLRQVATQHPDWHVVGEDVDTASANDLLHRIAWRRLLDDAAKRRLDAVLVFKIDRAFRSEKPMHDTLAVGEPLGVGFLSAQEGFDTTSALGRLLLNLLASLAKFELELVRERVMARAQAHGETIGRSGRLEDTAFRQAWAILAPTVADGRLSRRETAKRLGCGESDGATVARGRGGALRGPAHDVMPPEYDRSGERR